MELIICEVQTAVRSVFLAARLAMQMILLCSLYSLCTQYSNSTVSVCFVCYRQACVQRSIPVLLLLSDPKKIYLSHRGDTLPR